jgi:hypothetical protein
MPLVSTKRWFIPAIKAPSGRFPAVVGNAGDNHLAIVPHMSETVEG